MHVVCTCTHHLLFISNTPCIPYYPQLSFCTLSTHTHIVHVICPCHLHVVRTCTHHFLVISNTPHIPYYPQLSFCTYCLHTHIVNIMCILSTDAYVMYISFLVLLFAYVHVIHIFSEHMHIMCTLSAVVLDIFLPHSCPHLHIICMCTCHPHIICSTPHGQRGPKLSFYSDRIWLLNGICLKNVELFHFRII